MVEEFRKVLFLGLGISLFALASERSPLFICRLLIDPSLQQGQTLGEGYVPARAEFAVLPEDHQPAGRTLRLIEDSAEFKRLVLVYIYSLGVTDYDLNSSAMDIYLGLVGTLYNGGKIREGGAKQITAFQDAAAMTWLNFNPNEPDAFVDVKKRAKWGAFINDYIASRLDRDPTFQPTKDWAMADPDLLYPRPYLSRFTLREDSFLVQPGEEAAVPHANHKLIFPGDVFRDGFRRRLLGVQKALEGLQSDARELKQVLRLNIYDEAEAMSEGAAELALEHTAQALEADKSFAYSSKSAQVIAEHSHRHVLAGIRIFLRSQARLNIKSILQTIAALRQFLLEEMSSPHNTEIERQRLRFIARYRVEGVLQELELAGLHWGEIGQKAGINSQETLQFSVDLAMIRSLQQAPVDAK